MGGQGFGACPGHQAAPRVRRGVIALANLEGRKGTPVACTALKAKRSSGQDLSAISPLCRTHHWIAALVPNTSRTAAENAFAP